ncbi:hypothetical protein ABIF50_009733 [Bradyrhizobium diazoefficiens]
MNGRPSATRRGKSGLEINGKAMKLVPDETGRGGERYVCPACEEDPLHDPAAQKRAESPLRPPANKNPALAPRPVVDPIERADSARRGPDFSGKSRNFIFGDELASGEVCSRRSRTWSTTSRCARRYIRSGPSTLARHRDVDAADTRRYLLERHLQGKWEARVSDAEELTGFGLAYLERLPEDEC